MKLFRCLTLVVFACLMGTTSYPMVEQKSTQAEQKIPKIQATHVYALYCEIHTLLEQEYAPDSIVTALKQQKIDVNAYEQNLYTGYTALHIAVHLNPTKTCIKIPQILLDAGADVDARINNPFIRLHSCTPLHTALFQGWLAYVPILLKARADINAQINNPSSTHGCTRHRWRPLDIATYNFASDLKMPTVVRSLVAHGADINGTLRRARKARGYKYSEDKILDAIIKGKVDQLIASSTESVQALIDLLKCTSLS